MSNYLPCAEPIALMSVGVQKAGRAGADRRQAHGAPCRAAERGAVQQTGQEPERGSEIISRPATCWGHWRGCHGKSLKEEGCTLSAEGKRGGTRAEEKCVLFCRTNSSSPGNSRAGVSPESPYVSPWEQAWRGTSADRRPLELS